MTTSHKTTGSSSANVLGMMIMLAASVMTMMMQPAAGFSTTPLRTMMSPSTTTSLFAEGGPQYDKQEGLLQRSECVGKGSYLLTIDYNNKGDDNDSDTDFPQYEPGHVLALEIQPPSPEEESSESSSPMGTMTEKTKTDLEKNGGWMRGPYTVSFGYGTDDATNNGFKVLIKEVGFKSNVFATSKPGTPVLFGGKFKVPIAEGIRTSSEAVDNEDETRGDTQRVVLISSGVGVGPCIGATEDLLRSPSDEKQPIASIDLIASYKTREEIAMEPALETLRSEFASKGKQEFEWKSVITSKEGRLSSNGPEFLRDNYLRSSNNSVVSAVTNTHYHIIGNGQLVSEWKEGLAKAGVPSSRVTVEAYFNHTAKPDRSAIDTICEAVLGLEKETTTAKTEKVPEAAASS